MHEVKPIVNIQDDQGDTLLHFVCQDGRMPILRDLVGRDLVDAILQNIDGDAALHLRAPGGLW